MEIGSQQQPVPYVVFPTIRVRANMRRLERGQRMLFRDRTRSAICVRDGEPECALSESRRDQDRRAESILRWWCRSDASRRSQARRQFAALPEDPKALALGQRVACVPHALRLPIVGLRNPQVAWEEHRLRKND